MPTWEYMILNAHQRRLRSMRVKVFEGGRLGQLVSVMLLRKLELVVFGVPGNGFAIDLVDLGEQEPVVAITGGRDDRVVAVFEEGIDLVR